MDGVYTETVTVQARDCDSLRHVNNAIYIDYLHEATLRAHGVSREMAAEVVMTALSAEYKAAARYGDRLAITTWVTEAAEGRVSRYYEIDRAEDGRRVLAARATWRIPGEPPPLVANRPVPLKPFVPPHEAAAAAFVWRHRIRRYQLDMRGVASVTAYLNWLEEATFRAAGAAGWPTGRMWHENLIILQYRRDSEFFADAGLGDAIEIESRYVYHARLRGTWRHDIYRLEEAGERRLLMRDYSTGAFLDRDLHPRTGIAEIAEALRGGPLDGQPTQEA